jgi:hypothetical protein
MLQINPFLDCTVYSRIVVHIAQNSQQAPKCCKWVVDCHVDEMIK